MPAWGQARREGRATLPSALSVSFNCVCVRVCCLSPLSIIVENTETKLPTNASSFLPTPSTLSGTDGRALPDGTPKVLTNGRGRRGSG